MSFERRARQVHWLKKSPRLSYQRSERHKAKTTVHRHPLRERRNERQIVALSVAIQREAAGKPAKNHAVPQAFFHRQQAKLANGTGLGQVGIEIFKLPLK